MVDGGLTVHSHNTQQILKPKNVSDPITRGGDKLLNILHFILNKYIRRMGCSFVLGTSLWHRVRCREIKSSIWIMSTMFPQYQKVTVLHPRLWTDSWQNIYFWSLPNWHTMAFVDVSDVLLSREIRMKSINDNSNYTKSERECGQGKCSGAFMPTSHYLRPSCLQHLLPANCGFSYLRVYLSSAP
jgi:hypothetical protein